ncbi:MAG: hypothetical protein AAGF20_03075 [Pseudomonadota bacterium]
MNPYSRFGLVSNTVSAAAILSVLAIFGSQIFGAITASVAPGSLAMWGAIGAVVAVLVVFWLAMTEAIFPTLFRFNTVRRLVLGKYYFEGTWLQSEKGDGHQRLSVIDIQPQGKGFIFSGYSLNQALEIESNTLIEFSKLEWPFMTYKYRNSLSDGGDGKREGVGEIQFEMNTASARRFNGYVQYVKNEERLKIEGAKLTSRREVKDLRTLQGRQKVFQKYWDLFFNAGITATATVPTQQAAPLSSETPAPSVSTDVPAADRRKATNPVITKDSVVPRRRASDWKGEVPAAKAEVKADRSTGTSK